MQDPKRTVLAGKAIAVPGNDIDTDRIIPARFLRCVTFDGLGEHAFEDDRKQQRASGKTHPFDDPSRASASILVVGRNFGCGSSREHAPQALMRWGKGLHAIVGESFAEIFFGNCVAIGVPCLTAGAADLQKLTEAIARDPGLELTVDLGAQQVRWATGHTGSEASLAQGSDPDGAAGKTDRTRALPGEQTQRRGSDAIVAKMPTGARMQLMTGRWDTTFELLEAVDGVARTAAALPYFAGYR